MKTAKIMFESSVILEGSKTACCRSPLLLQFESSVILEGSKTGEVFNLLGFGLRVVLF